MLIPKKILPNLTLLFSITLTSLLTLNSSYAQSTNSSLASNGCLNVVIANDFAYAACGQEIEVISLTTLERRLINVAADDISAPRPQHPIPPNNARPRRTHPKHLGAVTRG